MKIPLRRSLPALVLVLFGSMQPGLTGVGPDGRHIIIASLNIQRRIQSEGMFMELSRNPNISRADILLLQEAEGEPESRKHAIAGLAGALGLPYSYASENRLSAPGGDGLVTLSRFPLRHTTVLPLKQFDLLVNTRRRIALVHSVESPIGPLRLVNLHLDTRINTASRLQQVEPVIVATQGETVPVVIGGDFNTGYFRWLWHIMPISAWEDQAGAVLRQLSGFGFSTPFAGAGPTHDHLRLRLDWIFLRGLRWFARGIEKLDFTDHHAVWAEVGLP